MVTPNDILDALEALVREKFPEEEVYRERVPSGFQRPSTLIILEPFEGDANFGTSVVELRPVFTLTTFVEVDEYHHSHLRALHQRQLVLAGMFMPGYIRVKDPDDPHGKGRAPHVTELKLAGGYDYDTVTVTFSLTLSRADFMEAETAPMMEHFNFNTTAKE